MTRHSWSRRRCWQPDCTRPVNGWQSMFCDAHDAATQLPLIPAVPPTPSYHGIPKLTPEGRAHVATEAAIERVDAAAPQDWKEEAAEAIYQVCAHKPLFTPDDIWLAGLLKPPEPRAFGPAMRRAVVEGWCKSTGQFTCSVIPSQHRNPIRVYESLIFNGAGAVDAEVGT